jgi:hypothetical protein
MVSSDRFLGWRGDTCVLALQARERDVCFVKREREKTYLGNRCQLTFFGSCLFITSTLGWEYLRREMIKEEDERYFL